MRKFESGATRDTDDGKPDFAGFLSPVVLRQFGEYMHKHRHLPNGNVRAADDWKQGIPLEVYMSSAWRHFMDWYALHESDVHSEALMVDTLCAMLFNIQGYLHEYLKALNSTQVNPPMRFTGDASKVVELLNGLGRDGSN